MSQFIFSNQDARKLDHALYSLDEASEAIEAVYDQDLPGVVDNWLAAALNGIENARFALNQVRQLTR